MDHAIVLNNNSFPADSREEAVSLFEDALRGVLELNTGSDRFIFYLDSNDSGLSSFYLSDGFTYSDFVDGLSDFDLKLFLLEVDDKSPSLDFLTEEQLEEMA